MAFSVVWHTLLDERDDPPEGATLTTALSNDRTEPEELVYADTLLLVDALGRPAGRQRPPHGRGRRAVGPSASRPSGERAVRFGSAHDSSESIHARSQNASRSGVRTGRFASRQRRERRDSLAVHSFQWSSPSAPETVSFSSSSFSRTVSDLSLGGSSSAICSCGSGSPTITLPIIPSASWGVQ